MIPGHVSNLALSFAGRKKEVNERSLHLLFTRVIRSRRSWCQTLFSDTLLLLLSILDSIRNARWLRLVIVVGGSRSLPILRKLVSLLN